MLRTTHRMFCLVVAHYETTYTAQHDTTRRDTTRHDTTQQAGTPCGGPTTCSNKPSSDAPIALMLPFEDILL